MPLKDLELEKIIELNEGKDAYVNFVESLKPRQLKGNTAVLYSCSLDIVKSLIVTNLSNYLFQRLKPYSKNI